MRFSTLFFFTVAALLTLSTSSGVLPPRSEIDIDCLGSSRCSHLRLHGDPIVRFRELMEHGLSYLPGGPVPPDIYYHAGKHIACQTGQRNHVGVRGHLCVFLEGRNIPSHGINASMIVRKLDQLSKYGCDKCGSVAFGPYELKEDKEVLDLPRLTVNVVTRNVCEGMCEWHGYTGDCNSNECLRDILDEPDEGSELPYHDHDW